MTRLNFPIRYFSSNFCLFSHFCFFPYVLSCPRLDSGTWWTPGHWLALAMTLRAEVTNVFIPSPKDSVSHECALWDRGTSAYMWWFSKDGLEIDYTSPLSLQCGEAPHWWGKDYVHAPGFSPLVILFGNAWYFETEKPKSRNKKEIKTKNLVFDIFAHCMLPHRCIMGLSMWYKRYFWLKNNRTEA